MSKKILFIDLDGTLLKDDKTISEKNREAVRRVVETGNYLVIATGRAIESGRKIAMDLGIAKTGCYIVSYNGSVIYDCAADHILEQKRLPVEDTEYLISEAQKAGIYIQAYSNSQVLSVAYTKELDFYTKENGSSYRIEPDVWSLIDSEPPKLLLISLEDKSVLEKFQNDHREWEKGRCISFFSCDRYLEYCPQGATKAHGIEFLTKFLNIQKENTVAVGDQENDIPMIRSAYIGCAMKNAPDQVKEQADYVTEHTNNEDGVAEVIEKFILND